LYNLELNSKVIVRLLYFHIPFLHRLFHYSDEELQKLVCMQDWNAIGSLISKCFPGLKSFVFEHELDPNDSKTPLKKIEGESVSFNDEIQEKCNEILIAGITTCEGKRILFEDLLKTEDKHHSIETWLVEVINLI